MTMPETSGNIGRDVLFSRWRHGLIVTLTLLVVLYFAYRLESVLTPLLISLLIAYVLNPFVRQLEQKGVPRLLVVILAFVVLGLLIALAISFLIPLTIDESKDLGKWITEKFSLLIAWSQNQHSPRMTAVITQIRQALTDKWDEMIQYVLRNIGGVVGSTFTTLNLLILIPLYTFFFLWRFDRVISTVQSYLPEKSKQKIIHVVVQIDAVAANFFRGKLFVCLFIGGTTAVGFAVIGVPFAWLLGVLIGVLNMVPYIGPIIGIVPALLIAYIHFKDWRHPLYAFIVFAVLQILDGLVLTPIVQRKMVGLHPITTIVVLLIGGELAGVFGLILAVPAAAAFKILAREFLIPELVHKPTTVIQKVSKKKEVEK